MRTGRLAVAAIFAAAALAGCSTESVQNLSVGDCFNFEATATELDYVPTVDCAKPHNAEVYYVYDLPGSYVYSDATIFETSVEGCLDPFEEFVGVDFFATEAADLDIQTLSPLAEGWAAGDHEVVCIITALTPGEMLTGSVRNSLG